MTRAAISPWNPPAPPAPSVNARVAELERLTREALDMLAGARADSEPGRLAASRAAAAFQEAQATLAVLASLRERATAAGDRAAEICRQAEGGAP